MNTERKYLEKSYTISTDILFDILKIVLKNELPNNIESVNVRESTLLLKIKFPSDQPSIKSIKNDIEILLEDYDFFANHSPKDIHKFSTNTGEAEY